MHDLDFRNIPAVDRRIARSEAASRVSVLEGELTKQQADAAELANQLVSAREISARTEERLAEVTKELGELQSTLLALEESHGRLGAHFEERLAQVTQEATRLRSTLMDREAALLGAEQAHAEAAQLVDELRSALAERELALRASEEERAHAKAQLEALRQQLWTAKDEEITTCRRLANKCLFVIGFGRSNTTITLDILNCATNALILGEANFFLGEHGQNFTDGYNSQHREFQNQVTKATNAPDLLPETPHSWWQWLNSAAEFYDFVGEKIALSDYHLGKLPADDFRAFHEARFLTSGYIFMLRNPIDVLLSSAKLRNIADDASMTRICSAWLEFMQLWADFVRVFPRTMTIVSERFGEGIVRELEAFTGLELGEAQLLINPASKRRHKLTGKFPTLVRLKSQLEELYDDALAAVEENRVLWQAEQKRTAAAREGDSLSPGSGAVASRPLGRVWSRAQELREALAEASIEAEE